MNVAELAVGLLAVAGGGLVALAGLGLLRLPDALTRASAVAKAAALGVVVLLVAVVIRDPSPTVILVVIVIAIAHVVTVPLSGLAIGRAAYRSGTTATEVTGVDEPAELGLVDFGTPTATLQHHPDQPDDDAADDDTQRDHQGGVA
ncbi:MAG: monovalent cation/H(+) antiporter subunit G [Actinobacteria bacterium]|nr:monovalent cation/H(+) antiporter subunit G [Actinomycetota bacterium]MCB9411745.1 monovalent cation/H(+) antiporter subunit G [Actinomycetota bacterium]